MLERQTTNHKTRILGSVILASAVGLAALGGYEAYHNSQNLSESPIKIGVIENVPSQSLLNNTDLSLLNNNSIQELTPTLKELIKNTNFDANGSLEITNYNESPYFFPEGTEFLKIKNAKILIKGITNPKTSSEQIMLGVKAKEFEGKLVLILGTINKETIIRDNNSALLGMGPSALPIDSENFDFGVNLDYIKGSPIETAKDEATNTENIDALFKELNNNSSNKTDRIYSFILTRVQAATK